MHRFANCKTQSTSWDLADFLMVKVPGIAFMVQMPTRTEYEVWSVRGCPLPPSSRAEVAKFVIEFRELKMREQASQAPQVC